ncbi:MAG: tetratricopeptide repeat protein [Burkholderiales bacterium]|nr:tetratricopeptide repeat protein [Burkholderiales bacterium]
MASIEEGLRRAQDAHRRGRLDTAAAGYLAILGQAPAHVEVLHSLGILEAQRGRFAEAARRLDAAVRAAGDAATEQMRLDAGHALLECGEHAAARTHFEHVLTASAMCAPALAGAGVALWRLGRPGEALVVLDRLVASNGADADAFNTCGLVLLDLERPADALASFDQGLLRARDAPDCHSNRAAALLRLHRPEDALVAAERALKLMPDYAPGWINAGTALLYLMRPADALARFERALRLAPDDPEALCGMCDALVATGKSREAMSVCDRVIAAGTATAKVIAKRALLAYQAGQVTNAVQDYRAAKALDTHDADTLNGLAIALSAEGKVDEALDELAVAHAARPDHPGVISSLVFMEAFRAQLEASDYLSLAGRWEAVRLAGQPAATEPIPRAARGGARLRVGYVSGDFRRHAVSHFIEGLWRSHSRERVEVFAYAAYLDPVADAVTARLRGLADHWRVVHGLPTARAADLIRRDRLDVLIDLSGYAAHNRLDVFAARAAPVQAHYLGFFASTGIAAMDYWIGDGVITPPATDAHFSETVWRLPRTWLAYADGGEAPAPAWRPAADGRIRFGSFNVLQKLDAPTLALWARVLDAVPGSRLILKASVLGDAGVRERFGAVLSASGLGADRVELVDPRATRLWTEHMGSYADIDIALDPIGGVCGGTTSCDALWMGVPVVTMLGERMGARMSASMLDALELREWIAGSADEYVAIACRLAADVEARRRARTSLRERFIASPLGDAGGLATALEDAYAAMLAQATHRSSS